MIGRCGIGVCTGSSCVFRARDGIRDRIRVRGLGDVYKGQLQISMVSFMRFKQRKKVDLPQPEGPIIAITSLAPMSRSTP